MKTIVKSMLLVAMLMIGTVMQSCTSDPTLASINLTMRATTALSTVTSGRVAATGLEFTDVRVGVTEMEFETPEEESSEDSGDIEDNDGDGEDDNEDIEFEGEFVVDLIAGTSNPDFGVADLAPGIYNKIELDMKPIMDDGNTMFVAFNYTPDGATDPVRFEYSNAYELELEIEDEAGFQVDEGAINQMLLLLDLDALFANADLNTASADIDGVVRINDSSNQSLAAIIEQNLDSVMDGGEDEDGDGEIDDD